MDKLTAYKILRLEPGSSLEEIKAAYAALSKEFHPEEQPEEFQKIHEAYSVLVREHRHRGRKQITGEEVYSEPSREIHEEVVRRESEDHMYHFDDVLQREDEPGQYGDGQSAESACDFGRVFEYAQQNEQERIQQITLEALAEMERLLSPAYCNRLRLFEKFFNNKKYEEIIRTPEFVQGFANLLADSHLKKNIYDYFINFYRLRGLDYTTLSPEARALYQVLDEKRGMQVNSKKAVYFIFVVVIVILRAITKFGGHSGSGMFRTLAVCAALVIVCIFVYRILYKNHSSIFSQAICALIVVVSQLVMHMTYFYAAFLGYYNGIVLGRFLIMLGCIWLIVLGIIALVKRLKSAGGR